MARLKSIHDSSIGNQGKKKEKKKTGKKEKEGLKKERKSNCEHFGGFTKQIWLCQNPGLRAELLQWVAQCMISPLPTRHIPVAQFFSPVHPCPASLQPCWGPDSQDFRPGIHCPSCTWAHLKGKWQVAVLLQSSDLNLLLQPTERAELSEQPGCSAESYGLRGTNILLLLLGLLSAEWSPAGFIAQLYKHRCQHK